MDLFTKRNRLPTQQHMYIGEQGKNVGTIKDSDLLLL